MANSHNSADRFSDRVDNYVRYRPTYPPALLADLAARTCLSPATSIVADVGSGTGVLSTLLLPLAARVYAVEPNAPMRAAAEKQLSADPRFISVSGTAEATALPDRAVNLITAGQAFHWFEPVATRREFVRILKPGGQVALIWNERDNVGTTFLKAYENILREHATDYARSRHTLVNDLMIASFFEPATFEVVEHPSAQFLDLDGLIGRALSSSYAPNVGHDGHVAFIAALKNLFAQHARDGRVEIRYRSRMFLGAL